MSASPPSPHQQDPKELVRLREGRLQELLSAERAAFEYEAKAERLAEAAECYLTAWSEEGIAEARLELSRAKDAFRSLSTPADSQEQG